MTNDIDIFSKIEEALITKNQKLFWDVANKTTPSFLFSIIENFPNEFNDFVRSCSESFKKGFSPITHYPFFSFCIYGEYDWSKYRSKLQRHLKKFDIFPIVVKEVDDYIYSNFKDIRNFNKDVWIVAERKNNSLRQWNYNFESFSYECKTEIKEYIHFLLDTNNTKEYVWSNLSRISTLYENWISLYGNVLESFLDINYFHVQQLVVHFQQSEGNYSLNTIRQFFTATKLFINWLLEKNSLSVQNPFEKYSFKNTQSYTQSTEYIPDFVVDRINENLSLLPDTARAVWTVLMNTGMRVSEVLGLEEDCLEYDEKNKLYKLKYKPSKTMKTRIQKGLSEYHSIPIPNLVFETVRKEINKTIALRQESGLNLIFLRELKHKITPVLAKTISEQINNTIKKIDIRKSDGSLFHYKHHMCRKTFVVDMLEKGHEISEISDYVNHLSKETTEKYYSDLKLEKIADLDAKMFEQLFEETLDEKIKASYSEEEKESFLKEIKLGVRETPEGHGFCAKHVSFGPCVKKSCVGCKLLVTGPQKLPKWYQLYQEQQNYLNELKNEFEINGVEDYEESRLFQQETNLLKIYADTIDKTEKFAKRAGISIEQYKK